MKEQMKVLRWSANAYMMMAKLMKEKGYTDSKIAYAKEGIKCCKMEIELEKEWQKDATAEYKMVA